MRLFSQLGMPKAALAVGLAGAATAVLPATVASADDLGTGAAAFEKCVGNHCLAGALSTRIYPTGKGRDVVEFECDVTASGDAVSTTVSQCSVGSVNALVVPLSAPGPTVATAGVGTFPSGAQLTACVGGSAVWAEGTLGPVSFPDGGCGITIVVPV
jgi:hypothetical protein